VTWTLYTDCFCSVNYPFYSKIFKDWQECHYCIHNLYLTPSKLYDFSTLAQPIIIIYIYLNYQVYDLPHYTIVSEENIRVIVFWVFVVAVKVVDSKAPQISPVLLVIAFSPVTTMCNLTIFLNFEN